MDKAKLGMAESRYGDSALHMATRIGNFDIVKVLHHQLLSASQPPTDVGSVAIDACGYRDRPRLLS